jgi:hypothetical protein
LSNRFADSVEMIENEITGTYENFLRREILKSELQQMRDNLGYQEATEIERLLIKQVCLNWLRLNAVELIHHQRTTSPHQWEGGLYWEKRLDRANKRFNRTAETLAKVKRLLADAELKKEQAKIKRLRAEELERKQLPPGDLPPGPDKLTRALKAIGGMLEQSTFPQLEEGFIDAETPEN